jgi:hypothetical protein
MAKSSKDEMHADAWSRFERAVDVVAKSTPQHRTKEKKSPKKKMTTKMGKPKEESGGD